MPLGPAGANGQISPVSFLYPLRFCGGNPLLINLERLGRGAVGGMIRRTLDGFSVLVFSFSSRCEYEQGSLPGCPPPKDARIAVRGGREKLFCVRVPLEASANGFRNYFRKEKGKNFWWLGMISSCSTRWRCGSTKLEKLEMESVGQRTGLGAFANRLALDKHSGRRWNWGGTDL